MTQFFKQFLCLFIISLSVGAAELVLQPGDTATIQPNKSTTVICSEGSDSVSCVSAINAMKTKYEACAKAYTRSYCFDQLWPKFKTTSPKCIESAFTACNDLCTVSYTTSYCYNTCSN